MIKVSTPAGVPKWCATPSQYGCVCESLTLAAKSDAWPLEEPSDSSSEADIDVQQEGSADNKQRVKMGLIRVLKYAELGFR